MEHYNATIQEEKDTLVLQNNSLTERLEAVTNEKLPSHQFDGQTPIDKTLDLLQCLIMVGLAICLHLHFSEKKRIVCAACVLHSPGVQLTHRPFGRPEVTFPPLPPPLLGAQALHAPLYCCCCIHSSRQCTGPANEMPTASIWSPHPNSFSQVMQTIDWYIIKSAAPHDSRA